MGKELIGEAYWTIQVCLGTDRSPREGPAQSERGMDRQKPPGEDKDSEPAADGPAASEEPGATEPGLPVVCVGEFSVPSSGSSRLQKPPHDCR